MALLAACLYVSVSLPTLSFTKTKTYLQFFGVIKTSVLRLRNGTVLDLGYVFLSVCVFIVYLAVSIHITCQVYVYPVGGLRSAQSALLQEQEILLCFSYHIDSDLSPHLLGL